LALVSGVKESDVMNKNTKISEYTDEPLQMGERVADFLPSPQDLAEAGEVIKVTIALSKNSVDFFKQEAQAHNSSYQKMIRKLLDEYVRKFQQTDLHPS